MRLIHTEKASKVQLFTCCCFKVASTRRNIATASGNFAVSVILSLICWSYRAGNQNQLQCPPRFRCASIRPSNFPNVLRDFKLSARFWAFEIVPFLLKHQQTRWTRRKNFFHVRPVFRHFVGRFSHFPEESNRKRISVHKIPISGPFASKNFDDSTLWAIALIWILLDG